MDKEKFGMMKSDEYIQSEKDILPFHQRLEVIEFLNRARCLNKEQFEKIRDRGKEINLDTARRWSNRVDIFLAGLSEYKKRANYNNNHYKELPNVL